MKTFEELPDELVVLGKEGEEADSFRPCMMGIIYGADVSDRVVYDSDMVIDTLMKNNDWDHEEAREWFDFNILGAYVGEGSPVYMYLHNSEYHLNKGEKDAE